MKMIFNGKKGLVPLAALRLAAIAKAQKGYRATSGFTGNMKNRAVGGFSSVKNRIQNTPGASLVGALATGKGKEHPHGGNAMVIFAFFLFLLDVLTEYKGFKIVELGSVFSIFQLIGSLAYVVGVWAFFHWILSKDKSIQSLFIFVLVLIVVIMSFVFSLKFDPLSIFHVAFILIFWAGFAKHQYEDETKSNIFLILLLVIDLYSYSIFALVPGFDPSWLKGIPLLFVITVSIIWGQTRSGLALFFMIAVVAWYFLLGGPQFAEKLNLTGILIERTGIPSIKEFPGLILNKLIKEPFNKLSTSTSAWLSGKVEYAITGKVEENQFEPLGVYLQDVQSADTIFYEGEDVIVWGTLSAKTLDDPIHIQVGCFLGSSEDDEDDRVYAEKDNVDPKNKFTVFSLEEQDFACKFTDKQLSGDVLNDGSSSVTAFADFNFETLANLKVYFMNRERQRAMVREGLDVFEEFGITDTSPIPIFTNGPAAIDMGTSNPIVGVSDGYIVHPTLDFRIRNREDWLGGINDLKELVIFLPKGVNLNEKTSCNKEFKKYEPVHCRTSCTDFVETECNDVCKILATETSSRSSCETVCVESRDKCNRVCDSLFSESGQQYDAFALDLGELKTRSGSDDNEKFKTFRCSLSPTDEVLGPSPITTKFIRLKARYDYTVESVVNIKYDDDFVAAPSELRVSYVYGEEEGKIEGIKLEWDLSKDDGANADDVKNYKVYRKENDEEFKEIKKLKIKTKEYLDKDIDLEALNGDAEERVSYSYYVEAIDNEGNNEGSNVVTVPDDPGTSDPDSNDCNAICEEQENECDAFCPDTDCSDQCVIDKINCLASCG
jgi:hypothetical protein